LTYEEFKKLHAEGRVEVEKSAASDFLDDLPKKKRNPIAVRATAGVVSAVVGILVMTTLSVLLGIAIVAAATPWFSRKAKAATQSAILDHAAENKAFFDRLAEHEALKTRA
jgi:hypothetical protein